MTEPDVSAAQMADLSGETDADLLVYMSLAEEDPPCARAAWEVFYRRHVDYLYHVCLRAYANVLRGEAPVADIVADTLRLAYEHAARFDPAGITDADRLRLRARAWLGWIARRRVQDLLRSRGQVRTCNMDLDGWQRVAQPDRPVSKPSPQHQRVRDAIDALTKREQLVIQVTFQWYQPDRDHQRLPNDVAADLAATLGTTPENLRQIRRRALKKIEAHVQQHQGAT